MRHGHRLSRLGVAWQTSDGGQSWSKPVTLGHRNWLDSVIYTGSLITTGSAAAITPTTASTLRSNTHAKIILRSKLDSTPNSAYVYSSSVCEYYFINSLFFKSRAMITKASALLHRANITNGYGGKDVRHVFRANHFSDYWGCRRHRACWCTCGF